MTGKIFKISSIIAIITGLFLASPFTMYAYVPSITTYSATYISPMNATFNGSVGFGGGSGSAWFEYGTDLNFGKATNLNAFNFNYGNGGNFSTNVSALTPDTLYYYRAVTQNSSGRANGNIVSFRTAVSDSGYGSGSGTPAPIASTSSGTVLTSHTAQFNAVIFTGTTNVSDTWFEWGTTPTLGNQTTVVSLSNSPSVKHTDTITGLTAGTTYYFRAVAQNAYGRSNGNILNITTTGTPPVVVTPPPTVIDQVNTTTQVTNPDTSKTTNVDTNTNQNENNTQTNQAAAAGNASSPLPVNLLGWLVLVIIVLVLVIVTKQAQSEFHHE